MPITIIIAPSCVAGNKMTERIAGFWPGFMRRQCAKYPMRPIVRSINIWANTHGAELRAEVPGFAVDSAARALPIETSMHQEKRTSFNITLTAASQFGHL